MTIEVMRLSQKHREVILLYYYENMTTDEDEPLPGVFICDDRHVRITSYTL